MFGIRTPVKTSEAAKADKSTKSESLDVRRSIGEWEAGKPDHKTPPSEPKTSPKATKKPTKMATLVGSVRENVRRTSTEVAISPPKVQSYPNRITEARACLNKAKLHLGNSRNLKTDIKAEVTQAMERLYQLVKEAEQDKKRGKDPEEPLATKAPEPLKERELIHKLEEHTKLIKESQQRIEQLNESLKTHQNALALTTIPTYASVTAIDAKKNTPVKRNTLHSVVVTSENEKETGDEVLEKVRKAVNAKDGWITIERVRKAKDRKVIMGFGTVSERNKLKEKLGQKGTGLNVEEVKNRDPLLILKDVLTANTDEDVLKALRNQNAGVFHGLSEDEARLSVKYRRRARNPHTGHIVISTSPKIWQRLVEKGYAHIDLQRIKVEDQTPLLQCTRCLGFGHGKRFCVEKVDLCSHCGGPHVRAECPDFVAGVPPRCRNCLKAELHDTEHDSFSRDCPVRRRRDELARTTVAYC